MLERRKGRVSEAGDCDAMQWNMGSYVLEYNDVKGALV
jgi:hypothetical protein